MSLKNLTFIDAVRWVILSGFLAISLMLVRMQVFQTINYQVIAEKNYVRIKRIPPTRGSILDRSFRPLASNRPAFNLYFIPGRIRKQVDLSLFLASVLDYNPTEFNQQIRKNRSNPYGEVLLEHNVPYDRYIEISEHLNYYPSLFFRTEDVRYYHSHSQFLGHVSRINEREFIARKDQGYTRNDLIGKTGIERQYEKLLHGKPGYRVIQVDARGKSLSLLKHNLETPVQQGTSIILTIDSELQSMIEGLLTEAELPGTVGIMDIKTGGMLASMSFPMYDPNIFTRPIPKHVWDMLINNPGKPMLDRLTQARYPPGSTFKPLPASWGLQTGLITPETRMSFCDGGTTIGDRYFGCWNEWGHGRSNVVKALRVSCDVYFYDLSQMMNLDSFGAFLHENRIFRKTGIDLPSEETGFFPDTDWYRNNYGPYTSIKGQMVNLSIGQGEVLMTPLQVLCYYAALGNNGIWFTPHYFDRLVEDNNSKWFSIPKYENLLNVDSAILDVMQESLWEAVNHTDGTGKAAQTDGLKVWGKTGSSENPHGELTHAWFAGFAGKESPEVAIVVFLENAGHGGSVAAPIAGKIFSYWHQMNMAYGE